jgi:hypothetical protein
MRRFTGEGDACCALLTGLVGHAPELDLLIFQRLSAKPVAGYHENLTTCRAGVRPGLRSAGANAAKLGISQA